MNNYEITATPERIYNFLSDIAAGKESLAYVEKWIATNLAEPRKEQGVTHKWSRNRIEKSKKKSTERSVTKSGTRWWKKLFEKTRNYSKN
jgi:hypothetical protein